MSSRIPFTFKSFSSRFPFNRVALYSSTTLVLGGVSFYRYHSTQPSTYLPNNTLEVASYSSPQLYNDYASSANTNKVFQRITIPSGKASVINYNPIDTENDLHHILITVQGKGEVHYDKMINGMNNIVKKQLKLGNSVGIPSTNWHQIVNKHDSKDLVLVVTSVPQK